MYILFNLIIPIIFDGITIDFQFAAIKCVAAVMLACKNNYLYNVVPLKSHSTIVLGTFPTICCIFICSYYQNLVIGSVHQICQNVALFAGAYSTCLPTLAEFPPPAVTCYTIFFTSYEMLH